MRLVLPAITAAIFSILSLGAIAADGPKPLFASDAVLNITISGPMDSIPREVGAKPVPGVLKVNGAAAESLPVMLTVRSTTRRRRDVCAFPPLRVEFTQKPGPTSVFKGQKRLKLVTHCQRTASFQNYVLLEYAAYRLYNALTPESFKVRLLKINYTGEDGKPLYDRVGIFIEDVDDVAKRNGQERLRGAHQINVAQLDAAAAARYAVFQYMISNLDWAMTIGAAGEDCCHNARLAAAKGATTGLIPLPYDFDYGGLVNPPYAVPPDSIKVANVRVRRWRGFCAHNEEAKAFMTQISARRAEMIGIVNQTPGLEDRPRQTADDYLGEFFDEISSPAKVADILKMCLRS